MSDSAPDSKTDASADVWQPDQYGRFRDERDQPFFDLLDLVEYYRGGFVVDLGCGTGRLTKELHEYCGAVETLGIDRSPAMLSQSAEFAGNGLSFRQADINQMLSPETDEWFDIIFSNAALQWLPDHESLLPRFVATLAVRGQLAVQMPANFDHPSHAIAHEVARMPEHQAALNGYVRRDPLHSAEWYSEQLAKLGFVEQHVRTQIYMHQLDGPEDVIEWVKGSLLTDYRKRLEPQQYERYLADYRERVLAELPDERPYHYTFKRLLFWARLDDGPSSGATT